MIFSYQNCLIQIQFFEKSFVTTKSNRVIPQLILHFEYLNTWTDGTITITPSSPYWTFFINISQALNGSKIPFNLDLL